MPRNIFDEDDEVRKSAPADSSGRRNIFDEEDSPYIQKQKKEEQRKSAVATFKSATPTLDLVHSVSVSKPWPVTKKEEPQQPVKEPTPYTATASDKKPSAFTEGLKKVAMFAFAPVQMMVAQKVVNEKVKEVASTDTGKKVLTAVPNLTKDATLRLYAAVDATIGKDRELMYSEVMNKLNERRVAPDQSTVEKVMFGAQGIVDGTVQSVLGTVLALSAGYVTKNPAVGYAVGAGYFGSMSASEQIEEKGKVYSTANIAIDTVGDMMLGATLTKLFGTSPAAWVKHLKTAGVETSTEYIQTLSKWANDYRMAETPEEKEAILQKAKDFHTSGQVWQMIATSMLTSGILTGGMSVLENSLAKASYGIGATDLGITTIPGPTSGTKVPVTVSDGDQTPTQDAPDNAGGAQVQETTTTTQGEQTTTTEAQGGVQEMSETGTFTRDAFDVLASLENKLSAIDNGGVNSNASSPTERQDDVKNITTLRRQFNDFAEQNKETVIKVGSGKVPTFSIEVLRVDDGTYLEKVSIMLANGGVGSAWSVTDTTGSRQEAIQSAVAFSRDYIQRYSNPSAQEKSQIKAIERELDSRFDTSTRVEDVPMADVKTQVKQLEAMIADLMTPEEAMSRTVQEVNMRWDTVASFYETQIAEPINKTLLVLADRASVLGGKKNRAQKSKVEKIAESYRNLKDDARKTFEDENYAFQEKFGELMYKHYQDLDVDGPEKDLVIEELVDFVYAERGREMYWQNTITEVVEGYAGVTEGMKQVKAETAKESRTEKPTDGYATFEEGRDAMAYVNPVLYKNAVKAKTADEFVGMMSKKKDRSDVDSKTLSDWFERVKKVEANITGKPNGSKKPTIFSVEQVIEKEQTTTKQKRADKMPVNGKKAAPKVTAKIVAEDDTTYTNADRNTVVKVRGVEEVVNTKQPLKRGDAKNLLAGEKQITFTVQTVHGKKMLVHETEKGRTAIYPTAFGISSTNLDDGQQVTLSRDDLKKGKTFRLRSAEGEVLGYNPLHDSAGRFDTNYDNEHLSDGEIKSALKKKSGIYFDDEKPTLFKRYILPQLRSLRATKDGETLVFFTKSGGDSQWVNLDFEQMFGYTIDETARVAIIDEDKLSTDGLDTDKIENGVRLAPTDAMTFAKVLPKKQKESDGPLGMSLKEEASIEAEEDLNTIREAMAKELGGKAVKYPDAKPEAGLLGRSIKAVTGPITAKIAQREGRKVIKRTEIANALSRAIGAPIKRGKFKQRALGIFKPNANVVRLKNKQSGGLPTVFHEMGHAFDFMVEKMSMKIPDTELDSLLTEYAGAIKTKKRKREEAFAEFLRYYMTQPEKANKKAPEFVQYFEKEMVRYPEIKNVIDEGARDYKRWNEQDASAQVLSHIGFKDKDSRTIGDKTLQTMDRLYEQAVDDLHPVAKYKALAEKTLGRPLSPDEDPYVLARLSRGWVSKADVMLEDGTFDTNYYKRDGKKVSPNFNGKSLRAILRGVEEQGAMDDFRVYLISKRAVELNARGIETGLSSETVKLAVEEQETKHSDFAQKQKELVEFQDRVLLYVKQMGLIDDAGYAKMRDMNKEYVPFYRVHEEMQAQMLSGKKGFGNASSGIKKIRGSEREIIDPLESIVKNTYALVHASERNGVSLALYNSSKKSPVLGQLAEEVPLSQVKAATVSGKDITKKAFGGELERMFLEPEVQQALEEMDDILLDVFRPAMLEKGTTITVMVDGKRKALELDPDLHRSLQALDVEGVAMIVKLLSYPAQFLRAGAVLAPDFMLRNPLRDQMTAFVYSKYGYLPMVDLARGMFGLFNKSDEYMVWKMSGGEQASLVSLDRKDLQKKFSQIVAGKFDKTLNVVKNPLAMLQILSSYTEAGTRIGEMRKGLRKGEDPKTAALASREVSLDFARIGSKSKTWNAIAAFYNPVIQGNDKLVRAFKEHPFKGTAKVMFGITLPSILLYLLNRDEEGWDEIPQWQKDLFWLVKVGDTWYRVPKPFEVGVLFGSVPERIMEYLDKKDPGMLGQTANAFREAVMPPIVPTAAVPLMEWWANKNYFLDRPIVPRGMEDMPNADQYTDQTSEVSKKLGELANLSPAKIDNLLYGYFATLGRYAVQGVDAVIKGTDIENTVSEPEPTKSDIPVLKSFVVREPAGSQSESVNTFYDKLDEARKHKNKYDALVKEGKYDEAEAYGMQYTDIGVAKYYEQTARDLSEMRKIRKQVEQDESLSPKDKRARMQEIDKEITTYAYRAVHMELDE